MIREDGKAQQINSEVSREPFQQGFHPDFAMVIVLTRNRIVS